MFFDFCTNASGPKYKHLIQPPSSIADTGSDSIQIRQSDAVAATLNIQPITQPLRVRFPDGHARSYICR